MATIPRKLTLLNSQSRRWRTRLWESITRPHPTISAPDQQRQARLVSAVTASLFGLFLIELAWVPFQPGFETLALPIALTVLGLVLAYVVSRTRYSTLGAVAALVVTAMSVLGQVAGTPTSTNVTPLASLQWLILPVLLGGLVLSARWIIVVTTFITFGIIGLVVLRPEIIPTNLIGVVIGFVVTIAAIIIAVRYIQERYLFRPQLEALRQTSRHLQRKNAELESANREIRDFAYIVAHDLRNPLVNVSGFVGEARFAVDDLRSAVVAGLAGLEDPARTRADKALQHELPEALDYIDASAQKMQLLIDEVLKLARIGSHEVTNEAIDLHALMTEVGGAFSHQLHQRDAVLAIQPMPIVQGDRLLLRQVLSNLLDNAIKYLDPVRPGRIQVFSQDATDEVIVHIRDNGRGIAREDHRKVFQLFRRARNVEGVQGEGVGLPYVQTVIQRQGGRIWFESTLNVGSTFSFSIPKNEQ